jgi:hypothetical protein
MHIILVGIVHSIQNSCIPLKTNILLKCSLTNYNVNFYYFIVSIYLRFHLFGNYSYESDVSDDPRWSFRVLSQRPLSTKHPEFVLL